METSKHLPLVFLDTNVIAAYLRGESPSSELFSPAVLKQVRLAINPVVLQELFFLVESSKNPEILDELQEEVNVIPVNLQKAEEYLKYAADLRNRIAELGTKV